MFGGVLYSHPRIRLKSRAIYDVLSISVMGAIVPSAGFLLGAGHLPSVPVVVCWFLLAGVCQLAAILEDRPYDAMAGVRTSAVIFGERTLIGWMVCQSVVAGAFAAWVGCSPRYYLATRVLLPAGVVAALGLTLTLHVSRGRRATSGRLFFPAKDWNRAAIVVALPAALSLTFLAYAAIKVDHAYLLPVDPWWVPDAHLPGESWRIPP